MNLTPNTVVEAVSPLQANVLFTGSLRPAGNYMVFSASASSNVAGTLTVQGSIDGLGWTDVQSWAVPAGGAGGGSITPLTYPYYRAVYLNGATAQSSFRLTTTIAGTSSEVLGPIDDVGATGGQVFNVKAFGAKGDGVTDDTAAIQAAIDAAGTNGYGGRVFFPAGRYMISATLTVPYHHVFLQGTSYGQDIEDYGTMPSGALYTNGLSSIKVTSAFTPTTPIIVFGTSGSTYYYQGGGVSDLLISGSSAALGSPQTATAGDAIDAYNVQMFDVHNVIIENTNGYGVYETSNLPGGVSFARCDRVFTWLTGKTGIYFDSGMYYNWITNCYIIESGGYGICSATPGQSFIARNHVETTQTGGSGTYRPGAGIYSAGSQTSVQDNNIVNTAGDGIYCVGYQSKVTDNVIENVNLSKGSYSGIYTEGATPCALIANNTIFDNQATPTTTYGVYSSANTSAYKCSILGNSIKNAVTAPVGYYSAAYTETHNNSGYNPAGPQTAPAIPTSGSAYTNPFPFDCAVYVTGGTVSAIAIGGTATGLTSGQFFVPAGETITLTYTAAPSWTWFGN